MTAHELARKLLEMPDEAVFITTEYGAINIDSVELCGCEAEIFIHMWEEKYDMIKERNTERKRDSR